MVSTRPKEVTREIISRWETKYPALKALNDATLGKGRGFEITRADAVRIANGAKEFNRIAGKWKDSVLWLDGITIEYRAKIKGYRFILADEHLIDRQKKTSVRLERTHRMEGVRLSVIRDADMSDHQRKLRALLSNQHFDTAGKIASQRDIARIALTQPETLPRLNGDGNA